MDILKKLPDSWLSILNAMHNGMIVIDHQGTIVICNQAAKRIFGNEKGLEPGRHFSEVRPTTWVDLKTILETGESQIGKKIELPKATIIVNRTPIIEDGNVCGVISVFQDISEYENIISELQGYKKLHRDLEAIIESSYDGLYITDGKADTIFVNNAYERITGLSRENLVGRNMRDLVKEKVFDHSVTLDVLKSKESVTIMQQIMKDKTVIVTGTPVFEDSGDIGLVVTNVRDITELNYLRSQLQKSRRISSRYQETLGEWHKFEHILEEMVVKSTSMVQVIQKAIKVAKVETSVLITGESGVGKSMLARIIHQMSSRKEKPFVKINCGAIPESLVESELFGYEKGAFTGAAAEGKAGLIEIGDTGTVFLDEIAELSPALQVKLLDIIENKSFVHVGGINPISVDIRIIAATNKNLEEMMEKGRFRKDLYYRLNVVPVHVPPLRQRTEDIPALISKMLIKLNSQGNETKEIDPDVVERLRSYQFPGNVRELINVIERMFVMSDGKQISFLDLPEDIKESPNLLTNLITEDKSLKEAVSALEIHMINEAFRHHHSLASAAKSLKIHPTTLWRKMDRYGIKMNIAKTQ
ncbi:MAG: sigma 54-interacting transcriptional regulator [Proteobacteria bacterium]|nr:sigma 54-interacting transcriptional regulator [Pseudomonadota bacterium]